MRLGAMQLGVSAVEAKAEEDANLPPKFQKQLVIGSLACLVSQEAPNFQRFCQNSGHTFFECTETMRKQLESEKLLVDVARALRNLRMNLRMMKSWRNSVCTSSGRHIFCFPGLWTKSSAIATNNAVSILNNAISGSKEQSKHLAEAEQKIECQGIFRLLKQYIYSKQTSRPVRSVQSGGRGAGKLPCSGSFPIAKRCR